MWGSHVYSDTTYHYVSQSAHESFVIYALPMNAANVAFALQTEIAVVPIIEDPAVDIILREVTQTSVHVSFNPNDACASYHVLIGSPSEIDMLIQLMQLPIEELVPMWGVHIYSDTTYTWNSQAPSSEFLIHVLPLNASGTAYPLQILSTIGGGQGAATVIGTVTQFGLNTPIANATVHFSGYHGTSVTTDSLGNYTISLVKGVPYQIEITATGFESYTESEYIIINDLETRNFILSSCIPVSNIIAESVDVTSATISWTENGTATSWNVKYGLAGFNPETEGTILTSATTSIELTELTISTGYDVYVQPDCGISGIGTWTGPLQFITIFNCAEGTTYATPIFGTEQTQTRNMPINTYFKYSYIQHILTATEIAEMGIATGTINTLSFQYFYSVPQNPKSITIYLGNTDVAEFENTTSWIPTSAMTTVYSDNFTFNNSGIDHWCTIVLNTPFEYTGSNLVIAVLNNSGEYSTGSEKTFNSSATEFNSTILYCADGNSPLNPANPFPAQSVVQERSNIKLEMCTIASTTCIVSGIVTNLSTNTPISNASVNFNGANGSVVTTDTTGFYSIELLQGSSYDITVSATGFESYSEIGYFVPSETTITKDFQLGTCISVSNLSVVETDLTTATIDWFENGTATSWNVEYGLNGFEQGTGTIVVANEHPFILTELVANNSYEFFVQPNCESTTGNWTGPMSFITQGCEVSDMCDVVLELTDSYGDGWNGASISVMMNGVLYGSATVESGLTAIVNVPVCQGAVDFIWTSGGWDDECSFVIKDIYDVVLYTSNPGQQTASGLFFTYNNLCAVPDMTMVMGTVKDLATNTPIQGAIITFAGTMTPSAVTNANGNYVLEALMGYTYNITVSAEGHNSLSENGYIPETAMETKNFLLNTPIINLSADEVTIQTTYMENGSQTVTLSNIGNGPVSWNSSMIYSDRSNNIPQGISYEEYRQLAGISETVESEKSPKSFGKAPEFTPDYLYQPINSRSTNSEACIAVGGNDLNHFIIENPAALTPYEVLLPEFTNCAEFYNGMYYTATSTSGIFGTINPTTGEFTQISTGNPYGSIAYNPNDDQMYGFSLGDHTTIYTIDLSTGAATEVITTTLTNYLLGFTITNDGRFLAIDAEIGGISEIDPSTGAIINSWAAGFVVNYGQDISCDRETNTPYWASYNQTAQIAQLYRFDLNTNNFELIGDFESQVSCFAIQSIMGWLSITPDHGILEAGATQEVTLIGDGSWAEEGSFHADVIFKTKNPNIGEFPLDVTFTIGDAPIICNPPTNLTAETEGSNINLTWTAPSSDEHYYKIYRGTEEIATISTTSYTDENLTSGNYCYTIKTVCETELSEASNEACAEIHANDCGTPENLTAEGNSEAATITIQWDAVPDALSYNIYVNGQQAATNWTNPSAVLENIDYDVEFCFQIEAVCQSGTSPRCDEVCITVPEPQSCDAPTNLTAVVNDNNVTISWEYAETSYPSNNTRDEVTFNVYRNNELIVSNLSETSFIDENLANGHYCYVATATCINGESDPSNDDCVDINLNIYEMENAFNIFPNPANDKVTIQGDNIESISVYNSLGQIINNVKVVNQSINTSSFECGTYIFRIITNDGIIVTKRVVIAH
ncbi:MAG: carboxypeptidase regulatory-like domain-containing protein [Bacteroidales bacterium]|nr:carboxypeptidase regulatory-like domain-containing protein [Bacteroidales bacterium]